LVLTSPCKDHFVQPEGGIMNEDLTRWRRFLKFTITLAPIIALGILSCAERRPLEPRVPASQMEEAKRLKSPLGDARNATSEIILAGKVLYEGRGACFNCHGVKGDGKGPAAAMIKPSPPRDFTDCTWHKQRDDGELFWIVKNGSPGTGMQALVPGMISEEEAWKIVAYERTFCKS
jgi:mono/diheme cytochrome c family protein